MGRKRKAPDGSTESNQTTPTEYKNGVHIGVHDQGHLLDFLTPISYPNVINRLDPLKCGSTTKEVEASIIAQKKQVANFFTKLNHKLNSPCSITSLTSPSPVSQMSRLNSFSKFNSLKSTHVDLDCDIRGRTIPEKNDKKGETEMGKKLESKAVIVIDSDDEDSGENINKIENETGIGSGNALVVSQKSGSDFWVGIEQSDTNDQLNKAITDGNGGPIMPFSQTASGLALPLIPKGPCWQPQIQYSKVVLQQYPEEARLQDLEVANHVEKRVEAAPPINPNIVTYKRKTRKLQSDIGKKRKVIPCSESQLQDPFASLTRTHAETPYPEEEMEESDSDGLEDLWKDMSLAMEYSKAEMALEKGEEKEKENEKEKEAEDDDEEDSCEHSFMLRDDLGLVCKICGIIKKKIETIFDFQFKKSTRKSYYYEPHGPRHNADDNTDFECLNFPQDDFEVTEIAIHPRHRKLIKRHQMEGFDFLVKNLVSESPSGCILAHAPGSGKTFMLIAFIQSFLAKYPSARPLVILPKGILPTWKRELQR